MSPEKNTNYYGWTSFVFADNGGVKQGILKMSFNWRVRVLSFLNGNQCRIGEW